MRTKIRFAIITSSMLASAGLIASSSVSHGQSQTQRQTQTHGQAQVQPQTPAVQTPDRIWSFLHAFTPWQSRSQSPNQHRYLPNQSQLTNLQQAQLEQSQLEQAQLHRTQLQRTQLQRTQLQQTQLQQQAQGQHTLGKGSGILEQGIHSESLGKIQRPELQSRMRYRQYEQQRKQAAVAPPVPQSSGNFEYGFADRETRQQDTLELQPSIVGNNEGQTQASPLQPLSRPVENFNEAGIAKTIQTQGFTPSVVGERGDARIAPTALAPAVAVDRPFVGEQQETLPKTKPSDFSLEPVVGPLKPDTTEPALITEPAIELVQEQEFGPEDLYELEAAIREQEITKAQTRETRVDSLEGPTGFAQSQKTLANGTEQAAALQEKLFNEIANPEIDHARSDRADSGNVFGDSMGQPQQKLSPLVETEIPTLKSGTEFSESFSGLADTTKKEGLALGTQDETGIAGSFSQRGTARTTISREGFVSKAQVAGPSVSSQLQEFNQSQRFVTVPSKSNRAGAWLCGWAPFFTLPIFGWFVTRTFARDGRRLDFEDGSGHRASFNETLQSEMQTKAAGLAERSNSGSSTAVLERSKSKTNSAQSRTRKSSLGKTGPGKASLAAGSLAATEMSILSTHESNDTKTSNAKTSKARTTNVSTDKHDGQISDKTVANLKSSSKAKCLPFEGAESTKSRTDFEATTRRTESESATVTRAGSEPTSDPRGTESAKARAGSEATTHRTGAEAKTTRTGSESTTCRTKFKSTRPGSESATTCGPTATPSDSDATPRRTELKTTRLGSESTTRSGSDTTTRSGSDTTAIRKGVEPGITERKISATRSEGSQAADQTQADYKISASSNETSQGDHSTSNVIGALASSVSQQREIGEIRDFNGFDDFTCLDGISSEVHRSLIGLGYKSYGELGKADPVRLKRQLLDDGYSIPLANLDHWTRQASFASEGDWENMDRFIRGSRVGLKKANDTTRLSSGSLSSNAKQALDDLTKIRGIGPATEKLLRTNGIQCFAQLAELDVSQIASLFKDNSRFQLIDIENWSKQAATFAKSTGVSDIQSLHPTSDGVNKDPLRQRKS